MLASFLKDFKEFAVRGNVIDLSVGVIIGASFNKIVDVFVQGILMPPLGYLTGGIRESGSREGVRGNIHFRSHDLTTHGFTG